MMPYITYMKNNPQLPKVLKCMTNCKHGKKHIKTRKTSNHRVQGLCFKIVVKPNAKQHNSILMKQ